MAEQVLPPPLHSGTERLRFLRETAREAAQAGDVEAVFRCLGYKPHAGQRAFHEARGYPRRVICTGRRFGKTLAAAMEACTTLLRGDNRGRGATRTLVLCPVAELSERIFRQVRTSLCRQLAFRPERLYDTGQRRELVMPWGSSLVCRSAAGEESVLGEGFDLALLDEAARLPPQVWEAVVEPALADRNGAAVFLSSPLAFGWFSGLWARCGNADWPEWWGYRGKTEENPAISRAWLAERQRTVSPEVWRREYCGEFVNLEGTVYPEWSELVHVSPEAEFDRRYPPMLTFDFGTTEASPFVCLVCQWREPGWLAVCGELVIAGRSTQECARRLAVWWGEQGFPRGETQASVGDIAARDSRLTLQDALTGAGILAGGRVLTHAQEVAAGIELMRQLLRQERVLVAPRCRVVREEFNGYTYRPGAHEGEPERGPRKTLDHTMDALRYLVWHMCRPRRARGLYRDPADPAGLLMPGDSGVGSVDEQALAEWQNGRRERRGEPPEPVPGPESSGPVAVLDMRAIERRRRGNVVWRVPIR